MPEEETDWGPESPGKRLEAHTGDTQRGLLAPRRSGSVGRGSVAKSDAPDQIHRRQPTGSEAVRSGNTFCARFWTDGMRDAPMLPDRPWLVKCEHCGTLVWIDEQTEVGEVDPWGSNTRDQKAFADALPASTPTLQDYAGFLAAGVSDKTKERYVRLRTWWAGNDRRRESGHSTPLDSFEARNLRAFVTLLDESEDNDRLMKAEALRESGDFADAERLLATDFPDELLQAVSIIRELNRNRNSTVAEMKF